MIVIKAAFPIEKMVKIRAGSIAVLITWFTVISANDNYTESLFLKPLLNNQLLGHFEFKTHSNKYYDGISDTFPQILQEIYHKYDILELHLSLTSGSWSYKNWGLPYRNAPGTGLELWIWFRPHLSQSAIEHNWQHIIHVLSGLICSSISSLDRSHTISPQFSFRPDSVIRSADRDQYHSKLLRYGQLPRETICTENLIPWKKLLPCYGLLQGLVSLLNSNDIYNSRFLSIEINLSEVCTSYSNCKVTKIELLQSASIVYDSIFLSDRDWSLRKLFGQGLLNSCPFASSSKIVYDITSNVTGFDHFKLSPNLYEVRPVFVDSEVRYLAEFDVNHLLNQSKHNIAVKYVSNEPKVGFFKFPYLTCAHYRLGYSEESGQFVIRINNNYWKEQRILLLATYLPFTHIYYHTLDIRFENGTKLNAIKKVFSSGSVGDSLSLKDRNPFMFELIVDLPATSTVYVTIDFDHIFLKWLQYPPDASHGFYLPSVVITTQLPLMNNQTQTVNKLVQIRSEIILLLLPIPDFSMPYNVICLACTVIALGFGPIYNATTKVAKIQTSTTHLSIKDRILSKLKNLLKFHKEKVE